ncbi:MAG: ADP-ribosylglycohydrolase family protein [Clostridiales bacterium]|jgi:ADP-ribosylglycohydrolase|nr:ADP-ribosylglycohydrolase family protein [Clostridiales bacterium]
MSVSLREKFFGCICGAHIGSAMGAVVEGWPHEKTDEIYGTLDALYPYEHYNNGWLREAGTTEDGIDRQKLMITAIIEKNDRISAEDLRKIWVRDINPKAPGGISEPYEGELLKISKTSIPARDIGRYCDYANLVTFSRSCHPVGMINAGDIRGAIDDVMEVGQVYHYANSNALKWACVTAAGIAAAMLPGATVESVLEAVFNNLDDRKRVEGRDDGWYADYAGVNIADELKKALELTKDCQNYKELRIAMDKVYYGEGMPYALAFANEIVTKGVVVFKFAGSDVKKAIITAVNMGRDTDCLAAVAAGLSGALNGAESIPKEWISQVDYASSIHRFTNNKRTLRECSDGLYGAFQKRLRNINAFTALMDIE